MEKDFLKKSLTHEQIDEARRIVLAYKKKFKLYLGIVHGKDIYYWSQGIFLINTLSIFLIIMLVSMIDTSIIQNIIAASNNSMDIISSLIGDDVRTSFLPAVLVSIIFFNLSILI